MTDSSGTKSLSIIVTKGSLDWAYPPFILSTTAAAMGLDVPGAVIAKNRYNKTRADHSLAARAAGGKKY